MMSTISIEDKTLPLLKDSIEMKKRALDFAAGRYEKRLRDFEKRHQLTTEVFLNRFQMGELGDNKEWFDWQYVSDAYAETQRQLNLLQGIRL